ncbi:MAG: hypothetical protein QN193_11320 [Armatimonadota bacterium]|nr:hypothetical protein [Armatimonadota bacterium]MDR7444738.1 hypothetical protein [Armatimonadota bacterium]MDR7571185.1 hypothetical protein [Armatimonadota bacterium]MDR7613258.1 hypothetical protein [Armatimonadota bacterium]
MRRLVALPGFSLAVPFLATAVLLLPLFGAAVAWVAPALAATSPRSWPILAANHLGTLGWGTLTAMGALHQMFPAMLGISHRPGRPALVQFALTVLGLLLLITGFLRQDADWVAVGGGISWASVGLLVVLLGRMLPHRRRWSRSVTGVLLSLFSLLLTVTWGALMALNWRFRFAPGLWLWAGVGVHAAVGLVGWFGQLVVSVSYYLLPRFTGVRLPGDGALGWLLGLLNVSVALLVVAALRADADLARAAAGLGALAAWAYARDLVRFLRGARQRAPDLTNGYWWAIAVQTAVLGALAAGWAAGGLRVEGVRLASASGLAILAGWVTWAIMGQLYKVTPFLMWHYRYAKGMSAEEVPRLPAPYFPREGVVAFVLSVGGSSLAGTGVLLGSPLLAAVGGWTFFAGTGVYALLMGLSWMVAAMRGAASGRPPVKHPAPGRSDP